MRTLGIVGLLLLLAACSSSKSPDLLYADVPPSVLHPQGNVAQFVFYYPRSLFWADDVADVDVGGQRACSLKSGTFLIRNITPSPYTPIAVSLCGRVGTARIAIQTTAGMRYYIRIAPSDNLTMTGQLARYSLAKPVMQNTLPWKAPSTGGPFTIDILDEPSALKELQSLKACVGCS